MEAGDQTDNTTLSLTLSLSLQPQPPPTPLPLRGTLLWLFLLLSITTDTKSHISPSPPTARMGPDHTAPGSIVESGSPTPRPRSALKMASAQAKASIQNMDTDFDTLCQLSYAPATQTTVVTTTTTTTTSFPPFAVKGPRNLSERDPKQYPLAAAPTPSSIKRFFFDVNGTPACFQEAEDSEVALQDVSCTSNMSPNLRVSHQ